MSLCCKAKINTPLMYEVPHKDTMKYEILPHLSVAKRGYVSGNYPGGSYSIRSLQVESLAANGRLLLRLHDVVSVGRGQHALQPLALAVASARVLCAVAHSHVYAA